MSIMYLLILFSLLVALAFLASFIWAVRSGQYDDNYTPSVRMLFDDFKPVDKPGRASPPEGNHGKHHD